MMSRLHRPTARINEGILLRECATSMIDISDGLYGDLSHILNASKVGAKIYSDQIPISSVLNKQPIDARRSMALHSGDAYELCFTLPKNKTPEDAFKFAQSDIIAAIAARG